MKQFVFAKDFGFIPAGRVLKQDCNGNYFLSQTDDEFLADTLPWVGSVKLRREYVESLPADVLLPVRDETVSANK